eukprot:2318739-Rhodomonas_salina.1
MKEEPTILFIGSRRFFYWIRGSCYPVMVDGPITTNFGKTAWINITHKGRGKDHTLHRALLEAWHHNMLLFHTTLTSSVRNGLAPQHAAVQRNEALTAELQNSTDRCFTDKVAGLASTEKLTMDVVYTKMTGLPARTPQRRLRCLPAATK